MSRRPATQTAESVRVEPIEIITTTTTTGLRNPPCCGRANAPRLLRTRCIGATRIADGVCTLCGHRLRIHYQLAGAAWTPVLAKDLTRPEPRKPQPERK
jgi:hypothetical protein